MNRSPFQLALRELRRRPVHWVAAAALGAVVLIALLTPILPLDRPDRTDTWQAYTPPTLGPGDGFWGHGWHLDEVFLEFESDEGDVRRLHELEDGREYGVIVSQKGGLTRYRMNDRVQVAGRYRATPCLRFVGRARSVSDLAGEKLHERFVREALRRVPIGAGTFTFLVPVPRRAGASYYLCITDGDAGSNGELGMALESELERAFQYRQARALGQLGPLRTVLRRDAKERYTRHFLARGMKWGDIKYETLIRPVSETELEELAS